MDNCGLFFFRWRWRCSGSCCCGGGCNSLSISLREIQSWSRRGGEDMVDTSTGLDELFNVPGEELDALEK